MSRRNDRQILLMAVMVVGMTALAVRGVGPPAPVQRATGRLVTPLQSLLTQGAGRGNAILAGLRELRAQRLRVIALEERIDTLEVENSQLEDLKRENLQLREELRFRRERLDLSLTGASVVGHRVAGEPGSLLHTVKLDVGEADGIAVGQAVASSRGLVGQVAVTGPHWSNVRLITDPSSAIWSRVQRSRATGVVFGSTTGELLMRFVPQNEPGAEPNIAEGDLVYTSGLSEQYPPLILIGQVVQVSQGDEKTHQEAVIRPSVNMNALEVVLVVDRWPVQAAPGAATAAP